MADSTEIDNQPLDQAEQEDVSGNLTKLREDVSSLSRRLFSSGRTEAAQAAEKIKARADLVAKSIGSGLNKGKEKGKIAADKVEGQIHDRPFIAVLITFAFGLIIGSLLFWRRRS